MFKTLARSDLKQIWITFVFLYKPVNIFLKKKKVADSFFCKKLNKKEWAREKETNFFKVYMTNSKPLYVFELWNT